MNAAIYDDNGFYYTDPSTGAIVQITDDDALSSYATRIESRLPFVDDVTGLPEPTTAAVLLVVAGPAALRRRRR